MDKEKLVREFIEEYRKKLSNEEIDISYPALSILEKTILEQGEILIKDEKTDKSEEYPNRITYEKLVEFEKNTGIRGGARRVLNILMQANKFMDDFGFPTYRTAIEIVNNKEHYKNCGNLSRAFLESYLKENKAI